MDKKRVEGLTWAKVVAVILNSKAELIMSLFSVAYYMPLSYVQNLVIQKHCLQSDHPRDYCLGNSINVTLEKLDQGQVSHLIFYYNFLRQFPGVILALFMGQWSDKYGRKYIMVASNAGCALSGLLYWLNAVYMDWPPVFVVLSAIPAGLSGEYSGFMLGLYGFIRDLHPLNALSVRVSTADGAEALAQQIGPLVGAQLFLRFGYSGVFLACVTLLTLGVICTIVFVEDRDFEKETKASVVLRDFFDFRGFISCVVIVFKKRDGHFRAYILCVMVSGFITTMAYAGWMEILYLYTRLTLQWDVEMLDLYNGFVGGANTFGSVVVLPVMVNLFHWSDCTLGVLGVVANVVYYLSLVFAHKTDYYYWTIYMQVFCILCYVTFRSIITKCISFSETGKVMAVYAVIQAGSTNIGQLVATSIYSHTYLVFPATFLVFAGSTGVVCVALYTWMFVDLKRMRIVLEDVEEEKRTRL